MWKYYRLEFVFIKIKIKKFFFLLKELEGPQDKKKLFSYKQLSQSSISRLDLFNLTANKVIPLAFVDLWQSLHSNCLKPTLPSSTFLSNIKSHLSALPDEAWDDSKFQLNFLTSLCFHLLPALLLNKFLNTV